VKNNFNLKSSLTDLMSELWIWTLKCTYYHNLGYTFMMLGTTNPLKHLQKQNWFWKA